MNEIILNVISVLVTVVVIPLITIFGTKLIKWIDCKVKNTTTATCLTNAAFIVENAVKMVAQTYVDSLKQSGNFDKEAQANALAKAKEAALTQMSAEIKNHLTKCFGDVDTWLTNQIESTIHTIKNS